MTAAQINPSAFAIYEMLLGAEGGPVTYPAIATGLWPGETFDRYHAAAIDRHLCELRNALAPETILRGPSGFHMPQAPAEPPRLKPDSRRVAVHVLPATRPALPGRTYWRPLPAGLASAAAGAMTRVIPPAIALQAQAAAQAAREASRA